MKFFSRFKPVAAPAEAAASGAAAQATRHYRLANDLKDRGDYAGALAEYDQAIALRPEYPAAHCNRAVVLGLLGRLTEAVAGYDRAIALDPADVIAYCNRGMLQTGLGHKEAALASFNAALSLQADCFAALFGSAALLQETQQWAKSLAAYDKALSVNPRDALAYYNRATVLRKLDRPEDALASVDQAIACNPAFEAALAGRAELLQRLGRLDAALDGYERALELNPTNPTTLSNRGVLLQRMGRFEAALADYDRAIELAPSDAESHFRRGTVLMDLGDDVSAMANYDGAIALNPQHLLAYLNRGARLGAAGSTKEALASYERSLEIDPEFSEGHYNLALAALKLGDFRRGWRAYEWRWRAESGVHFHQRRSFTQPLWLGSTGIAGKTILLYGEQGLGDSIQFCRYAESVASLGARILLEVPSKLVNLCESLTGVSQVVPFGNELPPFDVQCPLLSLPLACATTLETIPSLPSYLRADSRKVREWHDRLGRALKPRIGLTWSGNQAAGMNYRHFSLQSLLPHLPREFEYFCLQTDLTQADNDTLAAAPSITTFHESLMDLDNTAALCECMDLVISVDTSIAHLSGALGRKTWTLLAFNADWRWLENRDDSPWYPTMELFRQASPGDWIGVFERVSARLAEEFSLKTTSFPRIE